MGASPAASPGASLQKEWCESGMLIVVTGETPAAAWLLKKGTGWLTGRPSGQGAKGQPIMSHLNHQSIDDQVFNGWEKLFVLHLSKLA